VYKEDRSEPFWWGMFSLGGVVAALLIPVHILFVGLAVPLGLIDKSLLEYSRMKSLLANPLVKVYLFALLALPLFHAAHRVRFSLHEMGIRKLLLPLDILCYGGALLGTAVTLYVLWVI
jgi:fumarate reductase subunit D